MGFQNLGSFVDKLESENELNRIQMPVDSILEITEITDRVSKAGGKALLFENVQGSSVPLLINAFGSEKRMALALGQKRFEDIPRTIQSLFSAAEHDLSLNEKIKIAGKIIQLAQVRPKRVSRGPCQDIVYSGSAVDLTRLPILQCWPADAGRFITLPLVITKDPVTGRRNVGIYRMQVIGKNKTLMHWQTQKDGAVHALKAGQRKQRLPVAVVIGADPASVFSGVAPLPFGVDEFLFSGFMRLEAVKMVKCKTLDLEVPAESEIVLEGFVDPEERLSEGPFGDHTGVYTPRELFPVFHIECMTTRKKPIYLTTIVGKPPMEDFYMGKAIERTFLPLIKKQLPEVEDMNFPMEGTFNNAVIVSIDKQYPFQARKVCHAIWGLGQLSYTKVVIVVEKKIDVHDLRSVALNVFNNIDPRRDVFFVEGPVDTLNHASPQRDFGSKMGIDATSKWPEEGYTRVWPEDIEMDKATKDKVDKKWKQYGIDLVKHD